MSSLSAGIACAEEGPYLVELGLIGGMNYYVGDANGHLFMHPREAYGAHLRYKIDRRWSLQLKGYASRIAFKYPVADAGFIPSTTQPQMLTNKMISVDVCGEYNFFRYGLGSYGARPYTPYIFLGLGVSLYDDLSNYDNVAMYMPFGFGFKWNFAKHCSIHIAWQNNLHFTDDLENVEDYNDVERLNGSNFLNCDLTGNVMIGLVFDFIHAKKVCRSCDWY